MPISGKWNKNKNWKLHAPKAAPLTPGELQVLADEALRVIPERVRFYAPVVGVTYGGSPYETSVHAGEAAVQRAILTLTAC